MKANNKFLNFIAISFLIHICIMLSLLVTAHYQKADENKFEVVLLDNQASDKVAEEKKPDNKARRVVETDAATANETITEKAKYLSAKNNSVEKETIAKLADKFKNGQAKSQEAIKGQKAAAPSLFGEKFNAYDVMERKAAVQKDLNQNSDLNRNAQQAQQGQTQGQEATATDRLDKVDTSLKTALNTREYKYYGYYHRIKQQLNQYWQPEVRARVSRLLTQGRTIASESSNKVTKLIIVLNDAGTLVKVQVLGESGVRDLDEAAVEAFRQAAPFPNPPRGMVENDGTIKIRWDFVVES